ncbi:uncharacterized protein [Penaeus vannamei]|uniref:uncharacterized protein n=1 Tax=Penaeus vannamei TaxID=6689 RepID=UPI00387F5FB2
MSAKEVRFLDSSRSIKFLGSGRYGKARLVRWGEQEAVLKKGAGGAPLPLGLCREPVAMLISCAGATTLEQALRGSRWSEAKAVDVAVQVCRRVDQIHAKGLIHNDLKADNVMLDKTLGVSVIDFGTATPEGGVVGYQTDGSFRGEWLAPELLNGGASSRVSDAYSVGFLLGQIRDAMKRPSGKARASSGGGVHARFASAIKGAQRPEPERRLTLSEIAAQLKPPKKGVSS